MPVVVSAPDGRIYSIERIAPEIVQQEQRINESVRDCVARIVRERVIPKWPQYINAVVSVVTEASLPSTREKRHKWRCPAGSIIVDDSVPDPVPPYQTILDRLNAAATFDQTKQAMADWIRMKG